MRNFLLTGWCLAMAVLLGPFTAIPVLFMLPSLAKFAEEQGLSQPEVASSYSSGQDMEV